MPSFKKNRNTPTITSVGKEIINSSETDNSLLESAEVASSAIKKVTKKEITIPFHEEMSEILETIYAHYEGDISRRRICAKLLEKKLKEEKQRLGL